MNAPLRIREVRVHALSIPMRVRFEHAAATRDTADPVVVRLVAEAPYADISGFGETLARAYVTGETQTTVADDVREFFVPRLLDFRAESFSEAIEFADTLPALVEGRVVNAARAAVELALIDLAGKAFGRRAADLAGWLDLPGFQPPGCLADAGYSGIATGSTPKKLTRRLRLQRCLGLRDFKIKVAIDGWEQRLEQTYNVLRRAIDAGKATLRADANSAWTFDEACAALPVLERFGVSALEQPLSHNDDKYLPRLAARSEIDLIADESLLTPEDAERLLEDGGVQVFNVRIAKNGGLLPSLRIAHRAITANRDVQLGCLVGETSLLTAAGLAFLEICPRVRFVEGAFGRFLLRGDVTKRPIQFGIGGRVKRRSSPGLGVRVDERRLADYSTLAAQPIHL